MRGIATGVAEASVWSMSTEETHETLVELTRLEAQVAGLKLKVAAHAAEVDERDPVAAWAHATVQSPRLVRGQMKLARSLEARPSTQTALATGAVDVDQARVIVKAIDALPGEVGPELVAEAEAYLLEAAREHHAPALRILGRRLFEVIAPDEADAHETKLLEQEETDALAACRFSTWTDPAGRLQGRFTLPALAGAMLTKALTAIATAQWKHKNTDQAATVFARPTPERMGRAFVELLERYPTEKLPKPGGLNATVVVTLSYETLIGQLEKAGVILDTGHQISPGEARRLACRAGIIPAVLGGKSEVLDLGRKKRLFTPAQRIAAMIRDQHCTHPGCDTPAWASDLHHDQPWSQGGTTDLTNARTLCGRHHRLHHRTHPPDTASGPSYHPRT